MSLVTVASGKTLSTTNNIVQYGTLDLAGNAAVVAGGSLSLYGTVASVMGGGPPGAPATLTASGPCWIAPAATVSATSAGSGGAGLKVTAGSFDDFGTLNAGSAGLGASLTLVGTFLEETGAVINDYAGSTLTLTGGNAAADLKGTLNLLGTGSSPATLSNAQTLWIDHGTLNSTGASSAMPNVITGNVSLINTGTMQVGGSLPSYLDLSGGSLTVGGIAPGLPSTGGTLNLTTNSVLSMPAAAGVTSTFVVETNTPNPPGVVNMYGAEILLAPARVSSVDLEGGTLNTNGGTAAGGGPIGDEIMGSLTNNGSVAFGGALHTLAIDVGYTQTGTLAERLGNGTGTGIAPSDLLSVTGAATLGGTLQVTGLGRLNPGQTWNPVTYAMHTGDFAVRQFPQDGNPSWAASALGTFVDVTN